LHQTHAWISHSYARRITAAQISADDTLTAR
jgi:hypothetical protein